MEMTDLLLFVNNTWFCKTIYVLYYLPPSRRVISCKCRTVYCMFESAYGCL